MSLQTLRVALGGFMPAVITPLLRHAFKFEVEAAISATTTI